MNSRPKLFEHVIATIRPPAGCRRPDVIAAAGRRGLFQVVGVISKEDRLGHTGEPAMMAREGADGIAQIVTRRIPLGYLAEIETAPPGAGKPPDPAATLTTRSRSAGISDA
jgi:hypothetical protein